MGLWVHLISVCLSAPIPPLVSGYQATLYFPKLFPLVYVSASYNRGSRFSISGTLTWMVKLKKFFFKKACYMHSVNMEVCVKHMYAAGTPPYKPHEGMLSSLWFRTRDTYKYPEDSGCNGHPCFGCPPKPFIFISPCLIQ